MPRITESEKIANKKLQSDYKTLLLNKEEQQRLNEELIIENGNLLSLNKMATIARDYADSIIATVREPMLILDKNLRVKTANQAFYSFFLVNDQGINATVKKRITKAIGIAKLSTGRIHCSNDNPELNQIIISLSRHARDSESSTPAKSDIDNNTGKKCSNENPR